MKRLILGLVILSSASAFAERNSACDIYVGKHTCQLIDTNQEMTFKIKKQKSKYYLVEKIFGVENATEFKCEGDQLVNEMVAPLMDEYKVKTVFFLVNDNIKIEYSTGDLDDYVRLEFECIKK